MKIKKLSKKNSIILGIVALLVIGAAAYLFADSQDNKAQESTSEGISEQQTINLDPPTEEDAERADDNKQRIVDEQERQANQQNSGRSSVKPVITYAGQYGSSVEVGGYVNVFEEDGNCTAELKQGNKTVSKSVTGVRSANSVDCPAIIIPVSEFNPRGNYSVVLKYNSSKNNGTSDSREINIR